MRDRLGSDVVCLQAKKWDGPVGRPEIQKFVAALHSKRAETKLPEGEA
jgi:restriction system protein